MGDPWDSDIDLDADAAARLVESQFPELAPARLVRLGKGWDNDAYVVNDAWVFRFPRRTWAVQFMENETRVLPGLAERLPLPIPRHTHLGQPTESYRHPFASYAFLAGTPACAAAPDDAARMRAAAPLARFLRALHDVDPSAHHAAPDPVGRSNFPRQIEQVEQCLARIGDELAPDVAPRTLAALREHLDTPRFDGEPRLVHGDLYARHLLLEDDGAPCGVVDWGDVHAGDPALDLSIAFSFLPPAARSAFRDAYGPIDDDAWARAHFRALFYGAVLLDYGLQVGDAPLADVGRRALAYPLA